MIPDVPYWQADIKVAGRPVSIEYKDGEWSSDDDAVLADFMGVLIEDIANLPSNPYVVGTDWPTIFVTALRKFAPVYGAQTNLDYVDDMPEDAIN